ncbi:hypothetical protein BST12_17955 [Mycobacterium angelicum]|uniref:Uncharacterized protein n=1 Tax=Mycobacterium angelicum TaxID=470074 RepID=A0A1W9ZNA1_MYCAN|nr:hypothetical protein [Mycobacterium angelicum]MCV7200080.1 hypothetical protein [Mycobacterium angelicum]ORA19113.1 hypothetical protein BST12_17955 [Mycobacterium angelicum]
MSTTTRALDVAREVALVVPRTVSGVNQSTGWVPHSARGVRQFGEVLLDELVLSGFSLLGTNLPTELRPLDGCTAAGEELSALGIAGAHTEPAPLRIRAIRRHRIGGLAIALQERWDGQLYWYDGSHVGHVVPRRVQRVSERFLRMVAAEAAHE